METPRLALVTARAARQLDEDLAPLEAALRTAGAGIEIVDWDDLAAEWGAFDLAVLRSTWDYAKRLPEFLAWAQEVSQVTTLLNPLPVVRWNLDKHYLAELLHAGVPTVSSHFVEAGEDAAAGLQRFFALNPALGDFVVKPAVGAGARGARRYARADVELATKHAQRLLDERRAVLLQPYLDRIDSQGESSLIFYAGEFSHAIQKKALLRRGEEPDNALVRKEFISAHEPPPDELRAAAGALAAQPFGTLAYARVDLIRDAAGAPCVLELELSEPSMFFNVFPNAAHTFAAVLLASIHRRR